MVVFIQMGSRRMKAVGMEGRLPVDALVLHGQRPQSLTRRPPICRSCLCSPQPAQTSLQFPFPLSQIYGTGQAWAYGGSWLT